MAALVREAMDAGAAGFATSFAITHLGADGRPIPSRWAGQDEIEALCRGRRCRRSRRGRRSTAATACTFRDCYDLQLGIGVPDHLHRRAHVANGAHLKAMEIHREGLRRGADVWPQVSCRPLTFSMKMVEPFALNTNPVFAELMPATLDERRAAYADPAWRQRVRDAWATGRRASAPVGHVRDHGVVGPSGAGRPQARRCRRRAGPANRSTCCSTSRSTSPTSLLRVKAILANDDVDGVDMLLHEDGCTLGLSDAGAHVGQLCDAVLPTDLLGHWVRERHSLTLEEAVHKLTQVQADLFGFTDRGVLRPGARADVVVFDPKTVAPGPVRRVRDFPADGERLTADQPTGMCHLLVNGTVVQRDGEFSDDAIEQRPGVLLTPG